MLSRVLILGLITLLWAAPVGAQPEDPKILGVDMQGNEALPEARAYISISSPMPDSRARLNRGRKFSRALFRISPRRLSVQWNPRDRACSLSQVSRAWKTARIRLTCGS